MQTFYRDQKIYSTDLSNIVQRMGNLGIASLNSWGKTYGFFI
jgi:hypothetical protein